MENGNNDRRNFIKKVAAGAAFTTIGAMGFPAKSYGRIMGANDRIGVAIIGCGRRVGAYYNAIANKENNIRLTHICDVMKSQLDKTSKALSGILDYQPAVVEDFRKVLEDSKTDAIFNATPDHWHGPGSCMAMAAGKHVYLEKPCSHNPYESELLVAYQKKYNRVVQMGVQQRSSAESIDIITQIHDGVIGVPYKAIAFYSASRGRVINPEPAPVPEGLNWELFQGPAPRQEYKHDTWNYNWHWYGWTYGTAEAGNNGTHEFDIARWALKVDYPQHVSVEAGKRHFVDDGWTMYDTMEATFTFPGNLVIVWDGKSRNGYNAYGYERGTIIFGSEGSAFIDRNQYKLYDRKGDLLKERTSAQKEAGNVLGGGGNMSTAHILNFIDGIRGKAKLNSPITDGVKSNHLVHLSNIAYRVNKPLDIDPDNGRIFDREAMKLWRRDYAPGWEPEKVKA